MGAGRVDVQAAALSPAGPFPLLPDLRRADARASWPALAPRRRPYLGRAGASARPTGRADRGRDRGAGRPGRGRGGRCVAMAAPSRRAPRGVEAQPLVKPAASGNRARGGASGRVGLGRVLLLRASPLEAAFSLGFAEGPPPLPLPLDRAARCGASLGACEGRLSSAFRRPRPGHAHWEGAPRQQEGLGPERFAFS